MGAKLHSPDGGIPRIAPGEWQVLQSMFRAAGAPDLSAVNVYISFDTEHDGDLGELLRAESERPGSGFSVAGVTERTATTDASTERARRRIRESDQVIVICGEHTESALRVGIELELAKEEGTPYFLLWGRRGAMCAKPVGAKPAEGMYSWTRQILHDQIAFTSRKAQSDAAADAMRDARLKARSTPSGGAA
jgi:hypothetical protein